MATNTTSASPNGPQIHILSRQNYTTHHLLTLSSSPKAPLPPSSLRLRSRILGLTTNNFSYARLGHVMGWYDIYHIPTSAPEPYASSKEEWGRIAAWGYAEVTESTFPGVKAGSCVYGYLPIGTLEEIVSVKETEYKGQIFVVDEHRRGLWEIYNRLQVFPTAIERVAESRALGHDSLGYDALMGGLFGTSYNLNRYAFSWSSSANDKARLHPSGEGEWSAADATLDNAAVVLLNASGKTALSFAYCIRHLRPLEHQPKLVIGVCSATSTPSVKAARLYNHVLTYDDLCTAQKLLSPDDEDEKPSRTILIDFGARPGATESWTTSLSTPSRTHHQSKTPNFQFMAVGMPVHPYSPSEILTMLSQAPEGFIQVNANALREKGISLDGDTYFEESYRDFERFKGSSAVAGMQLSWDEGMEKWAEGWEALCRDEVPAGRGLLYKI